MDFTYSRQQTELRESTNSFLSAAHPFSRHRQTVSSGTGIDPEIWKSFAAQGWLALPFEKRNGGHGGGQIEVSLLAEAMGRALVIEPYVGSVILAGGLAERLGDEAQRLRILGPLIAGTARPALAHYEQVDALSPVVAATATRDGDSYTLSGHKVLVLGGPGADIYLVSARIADRDGAIGVFIVPSNSPGLATTDYLLVDGSRASDLRLVDVRVAAGDLLADVTASSAEIERAYDRAIATLAADAVGAMEALLEATVSHTKTRIQFDKPLSSFQALRHRMAEMAVKCHEARASALLATLSTELDGARRTRGIAGAKAKIGRASRHVAQEAIQIHGALGVSEESPVGAWFKRLYLFETLFGTTAQHLARYAALMKEPGESSASLLR